MPLTSSDFNQLDQEFTKPQLMKNNLPKKQLINDPSTHANNTNYASMMPSAFAGGRRSPNFVESESEGNGSEDDPQINHDEISKAAHNMLLDSNVLRRPSFISGGPNQRKTITSLLTQLKK